MENKPVKVKCEKCEKTSTLEEVSPITIEYRSSDNVKMTVTYWRCPKCNEPYIVVLADEKWKRLQFKLIEHQARMRKIATTGRTPDQALQNKGLSLKKDMDTYHTQLKDKYAEEVYQYLTSIKR